MNRVHGKPGFFSRGLWEIDPAAIGGIKGGSIRFLQFLSFVISNFLSNDSLLRAAALSFTMLLSLVPILAIAFSVLKGLGVQNRLAPLILNQVAAGSEVAASRIIAYIGNTNMRSVGAIGLIALLYTSISMLAGVEDAFNAVWGVSQTRSLYRKFSDYLSVLVSAPLLFLSATSITTTLQSKRLIGWILERAIIGDLFLFFLGLTPYLSVWIAFFLVYIFIPNTRVQYRSALLGAVLAGTLWQLAQWCYIHFQIGAGNYNAIYGTLAALPILMVWIYLSWIVVLFGMEVVAAHQNARTFRRDIRGDEVSQLCQELVALSALRHICESFHKGESGWDEEHLAIRLGIPLRIVRRTLEQLVRGGFIVHAGGAGHGYYPTRELDLVPVSQLLLSLRRHGVDCSLAGEEQAREILETVEQAVSAALEGITLRELACGEKIPHGVDKVGAVDI